jgi:hypothetical protein
MSTDPHQAASGRPSPTAAPARPSAPAPASALAPPPAPEGDPNERHFRSNLLTESAVRASSRRLHQLARRTAAAASAAHNASVTF